MSEKLRGNTIPSASLKVFEEVVTRLHNVQSNSVDSIYQIKTSLDKIHYMPIEEPKTENAKYPETLVFGEDAGNIGDVNQGLEGLQEKYGDLRIADTGIREATILGQGIGMAMRGLRPIAEIQYLDYILYC